MSRVARAMGTSRVPLLLALILGGATFAAAVMWLPEMTAGEATTTVDTTSVLVASRDLAAGTPIESDSMRVVEIPSEAVASGALTAPDQADGRMLRYPLGAGEQILASKFVDSRFVDGDQPASSGLAFVIPDGMRAVSVPLSEISGAGGLIVPGDRVDVLAAVDRRRLDPAEAPSVAASLEVAGEGSTQRGAVVTILQDTLVLAIGQSISPMPAVARAEGAQRADDVEAQPQAASVTLAVSPDQAQTLFMAVMEGSIGLALRPFGETETTTLMPVVTFTTSTPGADISQVAQR